MLDPSTKISVIVATFNVELTLERCLESIVAQTNKEYQVIIIDGGSTDGTLDIIKKYAEKIDYWESQPDRGICHAWNKALEHAKGQWIYFIGADDYLWAPDVLEKIIKLLERIDAETRIVYGQVVIVDSRGEMLECIGCPWEHARKAFARSLSIPHQGIFHRRELFEEFGGFDENFRILGDYDFLSRELPDRNAQFVDEIIAGMQFGGMSHNPHNSMMYLREIWRVKGKRGCRLPHPRFWLLVGKLSLRSMIWYGLGSDRASTLWDFLRYLRGKPPLWKKQ